MRTLRIAMAQMNPTVGDLIGNIRRITTWLRDAKEAKADLVKMVELYNRAHLFPLAAVYRWDQDHWDQIRSLF